MIPFYKINMHKNILRGHFSFGTRNTVNEKLQVSCAIFNSYQEAKQITMLRISANIWGFSFSRMGGWVIRHLEWGGGVKAVGEGEGLSGLHPSEITFHLWSLLKRLARVDLSFIPFTSRFVPISEEREDAKVTILENPPIPPPFLQKGKSTVL